METPTIRLKDRDTIYNMVGQKTAALVVLLNLFSLNRVRADAFYDALKAKGKYDVQTTSDARKSTIEDKRAAEMNARTANNPDFIPLSKLPSKTYSEAELKKMKDDESNQPETDDDRVDRETEARIKKEAGHDKLPAVAKSEPSVPAVPTKGKGPTVDFAKPPGPKVKVTTEDPDEVSFSGEDDDAPPAKTTKPASINTGSSTLNLRK